MSLQKSFFTFQSLLRMSIGLLLCLELSIYTVSAQTHTFEIEWDAPQTIRYNEQDYLFPKIKHQEFSGSKLIFISKVDLPDSYNYKVKVKKITYSPITQEDLTYLKATSYVFSDSIQVDVAISSDRGDKKLAIYCFPYAKVNGVLSRIQAVEVSYTQTAQTASILAKDFVSNSVLSDNASSWYKIAIPSDGIYKIDKALLVGLGINVSNLNPKHINIYGNASGRLPEKNSEYRADDLVKNAILVIGEADNVFNDEDYILFHAFGPSKLIPVNSTFTLDKNPYSNSAFYFIRISESESPLRIQDLASSDQTVSHFVTDYNYYDIHEVDNLNLVNAGQRFYGELFDSELTQNFSFSIPNISDELQFKVAMATSKGGTVAKYYHNSTLLKSSLFSSSLGDYFRNLDVFTLPNPPSNVNLTIEINRPNASVLTYLDKIEINTRRNLSFFGSEMYFRDTRSVGLGNRAQYTISNFPSNGFVWEISNRTQPALIIPNSFSNGNFVFTLNSDSLRQFIASSNSGFKSPILMGAVSSQNLHGLEAAEVLIVSNPAFISQANRLADLHRATGKSVHVVDVNQIYNEFSSGAQDPVAIRMFAKMFYDRANGVDSLMPKSLLLFGDGTFDPRSIVSNTNYLLTYQFENSESHIDGLVSDDFFALLDDDEAISPYDDLDIGVGRLLISSLAQAKEQVDKIETYLKNGMSGTQVADCCGGTVNDEGSFGDWRLNYVQIADDEENGYFVKIDAEPQSLNVKQNNPMMNADKIYSDAYVQQSVAGGQRYPEVVKAIDDRFQRGALMINYTGHGGEAGAAEERIITIPQILAYTNSPRLPLFVSATCEFTKYDDPFRVSAGEWMSINPIGGAIALMTTTRSVYFSTNTLVSLRLYDNVFARDAYMEPLTFGEIIRRTKNQAVTGSDNKRSFTLIGDPALQIALPRYKIVTDSINGLNPALAVDTIEALSKMTVKGHVEDQFGNIQSNFNGFLVPTVFDKPKKTKTLGQDSGSPVIEFDQQRNAMYKGKASIQNGYFSFDFVVPKDINYAYGNGKISYYGHNKVIDGGGSDTRLIVGGVNPLGINDTEGPTVELFLNDDSFVNGGLTDESPKLIANVFDENGINTVGNGIGHDIVAILDGKTDQPIILNDYYTSDLDTYKSGKLEYDFSGLAVGKHVLEFKIWDVNNNSSTVRVEFEVAEKQEISLSHVLNYPNPFTTVTDFYFEHNQVCESLETQIQIFTISGKLVKTINTPVKTRGFRTEAIPWDGRDDYGDKIARGVYIYRLTVETPDGEKASHLEKLVLL